MLRDKQLQGCLVLAGRYLLCLGAVALFWAGEVISHLRCGFGKKIYEVSNSCAALPDWEGFLEVIEAVCRSCMAVAVAGLIWDLVTNVARGAGLRYVNRLISSEGRAGYCKVLCKVTVVVWTLVVGGFAAFAPEPAEWVSFWGHFCEVACHTVIIVCLVGLVYDFLSAALRSDVQLAVQVKSFLLCRDHRSVMDVKLPRGLSGLELAEEERETADVAEEEEFLPFMRASVMWVSWILLLIFYLMAQQEVLTKGVRYFINAVDLVAWAGLWFTVLHNIHYSRSRRRPWFAVTNSFSCLFRASPLDPGRTLAVDPYAVEKPGGPVLGIVVDSKLQGDLEVLEGKPLGTHEDPGFFPVAPTIDPQRPPLALDPDDDRAPRKSCASQLLSWMGLAGSEFRSSPSDIRRV